MIERSTARAFFDKCLLAPIDLSHVNWILTANSEARLPLPLRSRLDIVQVERPAPRHFDALLGNVLRDLATRLDLPVTALAPITPELERWLRARFARHRSARLLAREVEAVVSALIRFAPRRTH